MLASRFLEEEIEQQHEQDVQSTPSATAAPKKPFDYLDDATDRSVVYHREEELRNYDQWRVNRYLSMGSAYCEVAALLSSARNLSNLDHYRVLLAALPKRKLYIKWLNRRGEDEQRPAIDAITYLYEIGVNDAKSMLDILGQAEIAAIIEQANELIKLENRK